MSKRSAVPVKERLSRERIADCAIALADAEGLDAVTIRRLAQDQGVTPMALYWHFKDKERLLDGIVERLLDDVVIPDAGPEAGGPAPWDERLRALLAAILDVLRGHPAVAELVPSRILLSETGLDITERALKLLREAGFTVEQTAQLGAQALTTLIQLVINEPGLLVGEQAEARQQRLRTKKAALQALSPERYPSVVASADALIECGSEKAYFDLGLDLFIAGVRGVRPAS